MNNKEKLKIAQKLLTEIVENWNENEVEFYDSKFSFDELVSEINSIDLKERWVIKCCLSNLELNLTTYVCPSGCENLKEFSKALALAES